MSNIRFSIRRQVTVIWHILANIGDAGDDINNLTKGSFNNYMDQVFPNLTTYLPPVDNYGQITYHLPFVQVTEWWLSTDHQPTSSRPRSYWMTLNRENPKVWAKVFFFYAYWRSYFMMLFIIQIANLGIYLPTSEKAFSLKGCAEMTCSTSHILPAGLKAV